MIIFGWRNYNKRDSVYRSDICENCGHLAQLHSFTTTPAPHVYWIPLFPIGQKRIVDQCPHCQMGREMKLKNWKKLRNEDVLPAIQNLKVNPADREQAITTLDLTSAFGTEEEFVEVVDLITPHFGQDPEVLLKMGWGMNRFQHPEEAQTLLNHSLTMKDDPEVRELMEFHRDAPKAPIPAKPNKVLQLFPFLIVPGIILTILSLTLFSGFTKKPSYVYLANGLPSSYEVTVNGTDHTLAANSQKKLDVDYGSVVVEGKAGETYPFSFEPIKVDLEAGFSDRLSGGKTLVFNPDRTALIAWQEVIYFPDDLKVATNEVLDGGDYRLQAGEQVYEFPRVDYPFRDAPDNIQMSSSKVTKSQLRLHDKLDPVERAEALLNAEEVELTEKFVRTQLTVDPDRLAGGLLPMLLVSGDLEAGLTFVEKRLDEKPILVEWHRFYQTIKPNVEFEADLLAEYQARLKAEPDNAHWVYLTARMLPDGAEQLAEFRRSTELDPPSAYGFHALGYNAWVNGRFDEAVENQNKALELEPEIVNFVEQKAEYLLAAGQYDELLKEAGAEFERYPADFESAQRMVSIQGAMGDRAGGEKIISRFIKASGGNFQLPADLQKTYRAVLRANMAAAAMDGETFIEEAGKVENTWWKFGTCMTEGDCKAAARHFARMMKEDGGVGFDDRLLLYANSALSGEEDIAEEQLKRFLTDNEEADTEVPGWFAKDATAPALQDLIDTNLDADLRSIIAIALAARYPDAPESAGYREYARKMNYNIGYPRIVIANLTK